MIDWAGIDPVLGTALGILSLCFFLSMIRVVRGPTLPDRVVALDLASAIAVGLLATYAVQSNVPILLDVAVVVALVGFLATIGFATHLDRGTK